MSVSLQHERENLYRVEVSGFLRKPEFERCGAALADEMRRIGPVKLLFVFDRFQGWEDHAAWNDLTFYVTHGDSIERIAIVADERWRDQALMFAAAGLRRAPVEFFARGADAAARAWLSA